MLTWASHNDHTQNKSTFAYYITSTYYYNQYQRCSNQTRWDTQICPQIVNHSIAYVQSISQHHQFHHLAILYTMHKVPHPGAYNTGMYKLTKQCRHLAMYQRGWALCTLHTITQQLADELHRLTMYHWLLYTMPVNTEKFTWWNTT